MQETTLQKIDKLEKENAELTQKLWRLQEVVVPHMRAQIQRHQADSQHSIVADLEEKLKESEDVVQLLQDQLDSRYQQNGDASMVNGDEQTHPKTLSNVSTTDEVRQYKDQAEHYATLYSDLKDQFDRRQKIFEDREVVLSEMMTLQLRLEGANQRLEDMQGDVLAKDKELQCRKDVYETLWNEHQLTKSIVEALKQEAQQVPVPRGHVTKEEFTTMNTNVKEEPDQSSTPHLGRRRGSGAHQKTEETKRRELFRLRTCVESLENSLKIKTEENRALNEELDKGENDKKQLENKLARASAAIAELSNQVRRLECDVATKVESIKRLNEKISNQAADMKHLEEIQMGIADENERQANDIAAFQKALSEKEMAIQTMQTAKNESDALKDSITFLEEQLLEKETKINMMRASLEQKSTELDFKDRDVQLWRARQQTIQKEKDEMESEAIVLKLKSASTPEGSVNRGAAQAPGSQPEQFVKDIEDREARIKALQRDLRQTRDAYESSLEAKELTLSKQRKEIALLEENLLAKSAYSPELHGHRDDEAQQLTRRLAKAMADIQAKKSKITVLEDQLCGANQKIIDLETIINDITVQGTSSSRAKATSIAIAPDATQGETGHATQNPELQRNVEDVNGKYVREQAALARDCHAKLLEKNGEIWTLMNERAKLHSKLEECQGMLQGKESMLNDLKKRHRNLEKQYDDGLRHEKQKVAALETDFQSKCKSLQSHSETVRLLESNLRTTFIALNTYKAKDAEQQKQIAELQQALAEARGHICSREDELRKQIAVLQRHLDVERQRHTYSPSTPAQQLPLSKQRLFNRETNLPAVVIKQKVESPNHQQIRGMMSSSSFQYAAPEPYGRSYYDTYQPSHHTEQRVHHTRPGLHRDRPAPYDTEIPRATEV